MSGADPADWSPADNLYSIAMSEAQWWMRTARLAILRIRDSEDGRVGFGSRQIDARQLIVALRQLLVAEELEQLALKQLGIDRAVRKELGRARQRFETALPDIIHMRNALMHFENWSRGTGQGPQKKKRQAGESAREVARLFWGFGYDPTTAQVSSGPYTIHLDVAERAATDLARAIYLAAHEVDRRTTAALHATVIAVLQHAGVPPAAPDLITVSHGPDLRIWLMLRVTSDADPAVLHETAIGVITALVNEGLHVASPSEPHATDVIHRLARGESLQVLQPTTRP